ncbi:MAG: hypothetical protein ACJ719_05150 [Nitrososphaeraceae archaeon]
MRISLLRFFLTLTLVIICKLYAHCTLAAISLNVDPTQINKSNISGFSTSAKAAISLTGLVLV